MESKIDGASTTLLSGDFNIYRYPMTEQFKAILLGSEKVFANPAFEEQLPLIEEEYGRLLDVLSHGGHFDAVNCWERDNPDAKCITIGESRVNEEGVSVPTETMLTS